MGLNEVFVGTFGYKQQAGELKEADPLSLMSKRP